MIRSAPALIALLTLGPALAGCSGFKPFWQSDSARAAAERSIEGPLTLARLAEQRGKTLDAERLYASLLERSPNNSVVHHRLAIIQSRKGRFEEANAYFDRALQLKPDNPTLICDAGYCLYLQHRLDEAESLFRRALDIDPQHEAANNNLALVLAERGDDRAAMALFRQTGTEARAHANMGFVYTRRGELDKAKEAYSRALSIDPQMFVAAEALVQLAQFERQARTAAAQARPPHAGWAEYSREADPHHRLVNHEAAADVRGDVTPPQATHDFAPPAVAQQQPAASHGVQMEQAVQMEFAPQQPLPPQHVRPPVPLPPTSPAATSPVGFSWAESP